jgi:hypothetical protein
MVVALILGRNFRKVVFFGLESESSVSKPHASRSNKQAGQIDLLADVVKLVDTLS